MHEKQFDRKDFQPQKDTMYETMPIYQNSCFFKTFFC